MISPPSEVKVDNGVTSPPSEVEVDNDVIPQREVVSQMEGVP